MKHAYNIEKDPNWYKSRMKWLGKFFYYSRAAKFYYNGDVLGFVWRWYHPASWIFAPIFFLVQVLLEGVIEAWKYKYDIGFGMNPYFIKNPNKLEWFRG